LSTAPNPTPDPGASPPDHPPPSRPVGAPPTRSWTARFGFALGRAVGATVRSLQSGPAERVEVDRTTETAQTRDEQGRTVILRRTTIDEVEVKP
jgi:hypothetical protein